MLKAKGVAIMTIEQLKAYAPRRTGSIGPRSKGFCAALLRLGDIIWTWRDRAPSRYALSRLSDHALKDIGLTRTDVYRESVKRFWRE